MGMKDMSERVAIVTGASSVSARRLPDVCRSRIKTVLAARSADKLEAVAGEIGDRAVPHWPVDRRHRGAQVVRLFRATIAAFGRVDILVNYAGLADHIPTVDLTLPTGSADRFDAHRSVLVWARSHAGDGEAEARPIY